MSLIHRALAAAVLSASLALAPATAFAADPTATASAPSEAAPPESQSPASAPGESASTEPAPAESASSEPAPSEPAPASTASETSDAADEPSPTETSRTDGDAERESIAATTASELLAADLSDPPAAAAQWVVDQLVDGNHFETSYECGTPEEPATCSFEDYGLTADAALALVAAGGHEADVANIAQYLEASADDYISSFGSTYAGSIAKLLLVATVTERDPGAFGGHDLVAELEDRRGTVEPGRYSDDPAKFDFSNTVVQSLAIIALARAGESVPTDAVTFLIDQQCPDGGFQAQFPTETASCASDPDSTGFALQAIAAAGGTGAAGEAGIAARQWLRDNRLSDGHWDAEGTVNATALASSGLLLVGDDVSSSVSWLTDAQLDDGALPINPGDTSGDARATTQAILALAGESLLSVGPGGSDRVILVGEPVTVPEDTTTPQLPAPAPVVPNDDLDPSEAAPVREVVPVSNEQSPGSVATSGELARTGASPIVPTTAALALFLLGVLLVAGGRVPATPAPRHRQRVR